MPEVLQVLSNLATLLFVITSMLALGLSLTIEQIIAPLKNTRFVLMTLLANFILVPILGYLLTVVLNLDQSLATGLILVSVVSGAPFLPKLALIAKGDAATAVGLMVLLMVVTIIVFLVSLWYKYGCIT